MSWHQLNIATRGTRRNRVPTVARQYLWVGNSGSSTTAHVEVPRLPDASLVPVEVQWVLLAADPSVWSHARGSVKLRAEV